MHCDVLLMETETITQKAITRLEEEEEADEGRSRLKAEPRVSGRGEAGTLHGTDFFISRNWSHARAFQRTNLDVRNSLVFLPHPPFALCKWKKKFIVLCSLTTVLHFFLLQSQAVLYKWHVLFCSARSLN